MPRGSQVTLCRCAPVRHAANGRPRNLTATCLEQPVRHAAFRPPTQGPPLVRHAAYEGTVTETSSSRPPRGIRDDDVDGAARVRCVGTFPVAPRLSTTRRIDVRPSNLTTALPRYGVKTLSPWLPANPPRGGLTFVRLCSREHVTPAAWAQTPWDHRGGKGQVGYETFNGPHDRNWPQGYPRLKDSVQTVLVPRAPNAAGGNHFHLRALSIEATRGSEGEEARKESNR